MSATAAAVQHLIDDRRLRTKLRSMLRKHDLTSTEWTILAVLAEEGEQGPTQVGKYLATSTELISITTPRLIKAGLCEVETSLNDLRWRRLSISQKGAAVLRAIETELAQLDVLPQVSGGPHV
jgi:DNA-binding MarR family transcriptional regulator